MSGGDIEIRPATRDDLPAMVRMLADDSMGAGRERWADPLPDAYVTAFDEIAADPNNHLIVAVRGAGVIGCIQLTYIRTLSRFGSLRAQIEGVRVARSARGLGLGRVLMEWAISDAVRRGCALVQLTTDKGRTDAHRFYESLGFVASHEGMKLAL